MTNRERLASLAMADATTRVARQKAPSPLDAKTEASAAYAPLWDEVFARATPVEQQEMLALARRQGLVYAHQIPAHRNGSAAGLDRVRRQLQFLTSADLSNLATVETNEISFVDEQLDANQRIAVARALASPDVFLIQGLPGTGKSRVAAEITIQAARRGNRVVVLAASHAALERVLNSACSCDEVYALCAAAGHSARDSLSATLRALTLDERVSGLRQQTLAATRSELAKQQERIAQLQHCAEVLTRLLAVGQRSVAIAALRGEIEALRQGCETEVESEAASKAGQSLWLKELESAATKRRERIARIDEVQAALTAKRLSSAAAQSEQEPRLKILREQALVKQHGHWWRTDWWRVTLNKKFKFELQNAETQAQQVVAELSDIDQRLQTLTNDRDQSEAEHQALCQELIAAEVARRLLELGRKDAALEGELTQLETKWRQGIDHISDVELRPEAMAAPAIESARHRLEESRTSAEQQIHLLREWLSVLEQSPDALGSMVLKNANVLGAVAAAIANDPLARDLTLAAPFDLMLVLDAQHISPTEFVALGQLARRWVLVGDLGPEQTRQHFLEQARQRLLPPMAGPAHLTANPASVFHHLWHPLHGSVQTVPYEWCEENDRLQCRLRSVSAEERSRLESERLADRPDIEIKIQARPDPTLIEISFPRSCSLPNAKAFVVRELDEVPVAPAPGIWRIIETPTQIVVVFGKSAARSMTVLALDNGVSESVAWHDDRNNAKKRYCQTHRLIFERSASWDRPRVEHWLEHRLGLLERRRTACLSIPYRMQPRLAEFASTLLLDDDFTVAEMRRDAPQCRHTTSSLAFEVVNFVPADSGLKNSVRRDGEKTHRHTSLRGGAGLELDLADKRHRDRLPNELRAELPAQGLVNYWEGLAVVRFLESLVLSENEMDGACSCPPLEERSIGVVAFYPSQVALLRRLIASSRILTRNRLRLTIELAANIARGEFDFMFICLTRSHTHRAVSFGDDPNQLLTAITRARQRVVVFCDPGTLHRRVQWEGSLDHLDDAAALWERRLIERIVQAMDHSTPAASLCCEGSGK